MVTFTADTDGLNEALGMYMQYTKKSMSEVLDKKGHDLRIQLHKLFHEKRWGARGSSGKQRGIALSELRARSEDGKGIRIRPTTKPSKRKRDRRGRRLSHYQQLVAGELERRERGIGVLGVTFLLRRWRRKGKPTRYLVQNKTGGGAIAMSISKTATRFVLTGFTEGLSLISARYGLLNRAIGVVLSDMIPYINRKMLEVARKSRLAA